MRADVSHVLDRTFNKHFVAQAGSHQCITAHHATTSRETITDSCMYGEIITPATTHGSGQRGMSSPNLLKRIKAGYNYNYRNPCSLQLEIAPGHTGRQQGTQHMPQTMQPAMCVMSHHNAQRTMLVSQVHLGCKGRAATAGLL
jgi:hypothetical protein